MTIGIDASRANVAQRTGTERYAWEVIRRLLPMLASHQIRLYVREQLRDDWPALTPNISVRVLSWPPAILWSHLRLSWELLWHRPDILFVPADTVPLIHPSNTVSTIHDVGFERWPELYRQQSVQRRLGWLRPLVHLAVRVLTGGQYGATERDYHRWSARQAVRSCRTILTVSQFSKQEIVQTLKADSQRIVVTYLGVRQPDHFAAVTADRRQALLSALGCQRSFFLFLGRLEKKKNIDLVVAAYRRYRRQQPNPADLVLAGSPGYGWPEVVKSLADPELARAVHVLGWQPDEVVDVLQVAAVALIFVSQYEGFGIPALESLSAGVPVLASRHGSLPEVLNGAALFVDTGDIDEVVNGYRRISLDQRLRHRLIAAGRQRVRSFTWSATAVATARVIMA